MCECRWALGVRLSFPSTLCVIWLAMSGSGSAADPNTDDPFKGNRSPSDVLDAAQWKRVDASVDRGLAYLASQQRADGSFATRPTGQPGITALTVLAFLSRGHVPGEGPYASQLLKAIDFVLTCQRDDGLLSLAEPEGHHTHDGASHAGNYNHAIAGLMLTEVYGMVQDERQARIAETVELALKFTRKQQTKSRNNPREKGGWRYLRPTPAGWAADISVSSWQLMFYRSARNAEFQVPTVYVEEALDYIRRGFDRSQDTFAYDLPGGANLATRGVAGGAIVSLALGGEHQSDAARSAGDWVLRHPFRHYNDGPGPYHYGAYYCSQGMFQLGGDYWAKFFPPLAETLLQNQARDGSWELENDNNGNSFGRTYTTALAVMALTPAYQLLPIFQR